MWLWATSGAVGMVYMYIYTSMQCWKCDEFQASTRTGRRLDVDSHCMCMYVSVGVLWTEGTDDKFVQGSGAICGGVSRFSSRTLLE